MITASDYMNDKSAKAMKIDKSKCRPLGYPRNDILRNANIDISQYFGKYKKYIIWYPTVKQFLDGRDYGIKPIEFLDNNKTITELNEYAKKYDILIIVKPHFAQIANIKTNSFSNIKFINDKFYKINSLIPYEFLGSCDALISDYSSVFYDFMLCDKPIGLVWKDLQEFSKNIGLFDFYEETTSGCTKIYSFEDLCEFIKNVAENVDELGKERRKVCSIVNLSNDKKSAELVTDFILNTSRL